MNGFALNLHTFHPMRNSSLLSLVRFIIPVLLVSVFVSCSPAKRVQKRGGYLHVSNTIKTDRPGINSDDLVNFAQPKPNNKILGLFRSGVWINDLFSGGRDTRTKRWLATKLGKEPVLLDSAYVDNSMIPMTIYLNNKGYFGAKVSRTIQLKRGRSKVRYFTHTSEPFKFGTISYIIAGDSLRYFMDGIQKSSLLKPGKQYDAYLIRDERERITRELRDIGYYAFSREYIFFEIDTSEYQRTADVAVRIENLRPRSGIKDDTVRYLNHERYFINNIYVNSNFADAASMGVTQTDTLAFRAKSDTLLRKSPDFYQIYRTQLRLRPIVLSRSLFIFPGQPYSQKYINLTYNRLQNLGLSRIVSVNVNPLAISNDTLLGYRLLDCDIRMVRAPVNMFTVDAEGTVAGGYFGIGSSLGYRNRNIFRGAETLRLKLKGAFELEPDFNIEGIDKSSIFNSLESGFEAGLDFPTLLTPFKFKRLGLNSKATTSVDMGFNYQQRTLYTRYVSYLSFGYEWNASQVARHLFTPVELSSVSIVRDSIFSVYLKDLGDPRFLNQYTDHLVLAMKYSFVFNNQVLNSGKNYWFLRGNIESAGNVLNLYSNLFDAKTDINGNYTLFGIRYAQYLRTDIDIRFYQPVRQGQSIAYRTAFGIGVPYGNSLALPFEKGFFAGGANGLRGWPIRSVGPGEYYSKVKSSFERVGDIWMEANIEYRFPMYSFLNGGLFLDAGNIWLLKESQDFPQGHFQASRFLKSLAVDSGLGFRFDFSFFIFRIDGGIPVYDPGKLSGSRWFRPLKFQMRDINWNFGIGYPF
ncbi:MAG: hypothetical protein CVT94_06190 [Bacteroidetes bacterium HGW-Bacteroidetes-11]|jgi:outer membrane protein assembly factor BamA|nr:MAG: hypothetical protein CVT94_06190 [Bacteroidetes bacterium HGW-Bacteroidetes-11]